MGEKSGETEPMGEKEKKKESSEELKNKVDKKRESGEMIGEQTTEIYYSFKQNRTLNNPKHKGNK